jgi:protein-tyrosine phosphatase
VIDRFRADSAGTGGWHVGNPPDPRSVAVAHKHGVRLPSRASQLLRAGDAEEFDLVLAMDRQNALTRRRIAGSRRRRSA